MWMWPIWPLRHPALCHLQVALPDGRESLGSQSWVFLRNMLHPNSHQIQGTGGRSPKYRQSIWEHGQYVYPASLQVESNRLRLSLRRKTERGGSRPICLAIVPGSRWSSGNRAHYDISILPRSDAHLWIWVRNIPVHLGPPPDGLQRNVPLGEKPANGMSLALSCVHPHLTALGHPRCDDMLPWERMYCLYTSSDCSWCLRLNDRPLRPSTRTPGSPLVAHRNLASSLFYTFLAMNLLWTVTYTVLLSLITRPAYALITVFNIPCTALSLIIDVAVSFCAWMHKIQCNICSNNCAVAFGIRCR